jgi:hypothetical protein
MNRKNKKRPKREEQAVRVWSYDEAKKAIPYVRSIVTSMRENQIEAVSRLREAKALSHRPGRPDRAALVEHAETSWLADAATARFEEAENELNALDVFTINAVRGEVAFPFVHDKKLAWFLFDQFDEEPIRFWRYHDDPLESRRPIAEALAEPKKN